MSDTTQTTADVEIDRGEDLGSPLSLFRGRDLLRRYAKQSMRGLSVAARLRAKEKAKRALEREAINHART